MYADQISVGTYKREGEKKILICEPSGLYVTSAWLYLAPVLSTAGVL